MMAMFQALMTEIKVKMDQQAVTMLDQQAAQIKELAAGFTQVKAEARQFTIEQCDSLKSEVMTELRYMREEAQAVEQTVVACREELVALQMTVQQQTSNRGGQAVAEGEEGSVWVPITSKWRRGSIESEPADVRAWGGASPRPGSGERTDAASPPPHGRRTPAPALTPPRSPPPPLGTSGGTVRRKPAEFDGRVAWEAYLAQFELLADAQGWDDAERALQLVSCLRGPALEVLAHLAPAQRMVHTSVVEALQRKFGKHHQAEVYRASLKSRTRNRGEPLSQLAQELETLVRRAYPTAPEDMVAVLARDHFVDALQQRQLQIYIKQAHPCDLQEALARALEFEAFLRTTGGAPGPSELRYSEEVTALPRHFRARRAQARENARGRRASPEQFRGDCWGCGQRGHKKSQCGSRRRTRSLEEPRRMVFKPCCWNCGRSDHVTSQCQRPKDVVQAGNSARLGNGAASQPEVLGPHGE